jgi:hypothetical protein
MKIEYVDNSTNGAFLRLFDFSQAEANELKNLLQDLADGKVDQVPVHEHCKVNPNDNAHLTFQKDGTNKGIHRQGSEFICSSSNDGLYNIIELLDSFALHAIEHTNKGFQWMDETSDISLLISPNPKC